jgi:phosphatidylinositol-3-phosphatase
MAMLRSTLATCLWLSILSGCGSKHIPGSASGGTGQNPPENPASTVTAVSVNCSSSTVKTGGTSQCNASVQGTGSYNTAVTWSATTGAINAAGLFTAPSSAGSVTVTAVSQQNSSITASASILVQLQTPPSQHVVIVMEENQQYSTVVGNTVGWPNFNLLIANGALATNYYADTHPSIGNYFMLTTGQILTNVDPSTTVFNVDNIARRMLAANVSFKVYAEGITQGYTGGNTGLYVIRHDPFPMLSDVATNPQVAGEVLCPFTQFAIDLAAGSLPEYSFIVPNVEDDADIEDDRNAIAQRADTWLQSNVVVPVSGYNAFQSGGDGVLIVDFDESVASDTAHGGGQVAAVFWGPIVLRGYQQTSTTIYQHESMLRTIMELLQLNNPPGNAATAPSMSEFFVQP